MCPRIVVEPFVEQSRPSRDRLGEHQVPHNASTILPRWDRVCVVVFLHVDYLGALVTTRHGPNSP